MLNGNDLSDLWSKTSGTWINVFAVLLGTMIGVVLKTRLPKGMQTIVTQSVGLITLLIGFSMSSSLSKVKAGQVDGIILGLVALVVGGLLGEWWHLDQKLETVGEWLKSRLRNYKGSDKFTEGFITASLLFCIGPMAFIGSLNNGATGDSTLLSLKATMDGLASVALAGSFGIGVGFSAIAILFYQGGLSLAASLLVQSLPDPSSAPPVILVTGVGGLLLLAMSLNLLKAAQLSVVSFLPAIALAPLFYFLATQLS